MPDRVAVAHLDKGLGPTQELPDGLLSGEQCTAWGCEKEGKGGTSRVPGWAGDGRGEVGTELCYSWRPGNLGLK